MTMHRGSVLTLIATVATVAVASQAGGATQALEVTIDNGPSGTVTSTEATFEFSAHGGSGAVSFECTLDGAGSSCTSPKSYSQLSAGDHLFVVTASDARRARASARRNWTIAPQPAPPPPPAPPPAPAPPPPPPPPPPPAPSPPNPVPLTPLPNVGTKHDEHKALCPRKRNPGKPIARGCSALQIVTNPDLAKPLVDALAKATSELGPISGLDKAAAPVARGLRRGTQQILVALNRVASGEVCGGAHASAVGVKTLKASLATFGGVVTTLRRGLQLKPLAGGGDADGRDVLWHELGYANALIVDAVNAGKDIASILQKACSAVAGNTTLHGLVASSDDAARLLRLADGKIVALARVPVHRGLTVGTRVTIGGVRFKDGTVFAKVITGGSGIAGLLAGKTLKVPPGVLPCLSLRIAPSSQNFLGDPASLTLHYPIAYKVNGVLRLEALMRLGVAPGSCSAESSAGDEFFNRYSMKISITYEDAVTGKTSTSEASDVEAGETALLPTPIDPATNATITADVQWETCTYVQSGIYVDQYGDVHQKKALACNLPQVLSTETYSAKVRPKDDYYFYLEYENVTTASGTPAFDLDDDDLAGFRVATFGGIIPSGATALILPGTNAYAYARGFLVAGNSSSKPVIKTLATGDAFAVYNVDAWNPSSAMVKGTRNGKPFWYAAGLPGLVRDVVNFCPGYHSYYRMPWLPGMQRQVTQGNNTTFTHKGQQKYAFDFGLWDGLKIRAARGGKVTYLEESLWQTSDPNKVEKGEQAWQPANALRIEHQDGTASWYYHMQQNGVLVDVDDKVHRGDEVAITGNTGNSTNPHLHYQVQDDPAEWMQSIQIKFQSVGSTCSVPQQDEWPMSNNT